MFNKFKKLLLWLFTSQPQMSDDEKAFRIWAFGTDRPGKTIDAMNKWNERHGHLFILNPLDSIKDTVPKMQEIWLKETGVQSKP